MVSIGSYMSSIGTASRYAAAADARAVASSKNISSSTPLSFRAGGGNAALANNVRNQLATWDIANKMNIETRISLDKQAIKSDNYFDKLVDMRNLIADNVGKTSGDDYEASRIQFSNMNLDFMKQMVVDMHDKATNSALSKVNPADHSVFSGAIDKIKDVLLSAISVAKNGDISNLSQYSDLSTQMTSAHSEMSTYLSGAGLNPSTMIQSMDRMVLVMSAFVGHSWNGVDSYQTNSSLSGSLSRAVSEYYKVVNSMDNAIGSYDGFTSSYINVADKDGRVITDEKLNEMTSNMTYENYFSDFMQTAFRSVDSSSYTFDSHLILFDSTIDRHYGRQDPSLYGYTDGNQYMSLFGTPNTIELEETLKLGEKLSDTLSLGLEKLQSLEMDREYSVFMAAQMEKERSLSAMAIANQNMRTYSSVLGDVAQQTGRLARFYA